MLKTKQRRLAIVAIVMFSMIAMYGGMPTVNAASMDVAKVTLSDSDLSAVGTSTVEFVMNTALVNTNYVLVTFASQFDTAVATATCPTNTTLSTTTDQIRCTINSQGLAANATSTITVLNVGNPSGAGSYSVTIASYSSGPDVVIETSETKVYVIDDVTVSAHVAASLTFSVTGTTTAIINGDTTSGSTSPDAIAFGTLNVDEQRIMGQELRVSTNATAGYTVTVQQDGNMQSAGGSDIDSFNIAGALWTGPTAVLGSEGTYGYMGVASDDMNYSGGGDLFAVSNYRGLNGTEALPIMSHTGPADGSTLNAGLTNVAYSIEVTGMQEAGDYENKITYVCTPTY